MKKIFKNRLFIFILGVLMTSVSVYAVSYLATDVTYSPKDTNWRVDNVHDALDELYETYNNGSTDGSASSGLVGKTITYNVKGQRPGWEHPAQVTTTIPIYVSGVTSFSVTMSSSYAETYSASFYLSDGSNNTATQTITNGGNYTVSSDYNMMYLTLNLTKDGDLSYKGYATFKVSITYY